MSAVYLYWSIPSLILGKVRLGWATSVDGYPLLWINMELYLCRSIPSLTLGKVRLGSEEEINIGGYLYVFK